MRFQKCTYKLSERGLLDVMYEPLEEAQRVVVIPKAPSAWKTESFWGLTAFVCDAAQPEKCSFVAVPKI